MKKSLFSKWVDEWFKPLVTKIVEKINGSKEGPTYLHKSMLRPEYSPTLKWESLSVNGTIVAADVVSMDSPLPLKKRDSLGGTTGDIPKVGMKLYMNERTMTDIGILVRSKGKLSLIVQKLFSDVKKCIMGVDEIMEFMFLQVLSSGVTVIADENNTGTGVRVDFGHPDSNKFGAVIPWSDPNAKPIDDIKRVMKVAKAAGDTPIVLFMDDLAFDNFSANSQVREGYAFSQNFSGGNIPVPDLDQVNSFLQKKHKLTIEIVDRMVVFEKNGKKNSVKPWTDNSVVFLTTTMTGTITYGTLAEEDYPVEGVAYQKAGEYTLVSKYSKNDPLQEFTSSQALALPVIDNIDSIYILNAEEAAIDSQTEGDAKFKYLEVDYTKASVLAGIKAANPTTKLSISSPDASMLKTINELSEEQITVFEALLVVAP